MNAERSAVLRGLLRRLAAPALAAVLALGLAGGAAGQGQGPSGLSGLTGRGDAAPAPAPAPVDRPPAAVLPDAALAFPADHGAHPDHRLEGWHVAANLEAPDGRAFGVQWSLVRQSLSLDPAAEGWSAPQLWIARAALTSAAAHLTAEKPGRGGVGRAGATAVPFRAWIDDWRLQSVGPAAPDAPIPPLRLTARGPGFAYDLRLVAAGPVVAPQAAEPARPGGAGPAPRRYALPFLEASGRIEMGGESLAVSGRAWLEREWSSPAPGAPASGWDGFALHLPEGGKLTVQRLRRDGGDPLQSCALIAPDGAVETLSPAQFTMTPVATAPVAGREIPVSWRLQIPSRALDVTTTPLNPQAWTPAEPPWWEGPIVFRGTHSGEGWMELAGY
ncbi:lipocalin-like domain-containing protein [Albimonas sp. CAU 1670]|uniref:lipocalin-like domain-containing protein n=1 Tax=Albimonas sp. CAU 1670 TaxID=3032599 RepID=UPI0023DCE8C6|nr:lipocalin-like domain-containing protein [Albimonas sp. CAU 1670]MDF2234879.1 lipocalin-like domain-containing protein [Albimonas sp. CAU 1670]